MLCRFWDWCNTKRPNKNLLNYYISDFSKLKFDEYHKDPYHLMNIIEYDELKKIL